MKRPVESEKGKGRSVCSLERRGKTSYWDIDWTGRVSNKLKKNPLVERNQTSIYRSQKKEGKERKFTQEENHINPTNRDSHSS